VGAEDPVSAVLAVDRLVLRRGTRAVLNGIDLSVGQGEFVALLGPSGSGKTTLLRAVAGLAAFDGGTVDVEGIRLEAGRLPSGPVARSLRRKVGLVFQGANLFEHLDAASNVALAPVHVLGLPAPEAARRARDLLDLLAVGDRASALPAELSGGEAQRVAIARALAMEPRLLLMDEPTASLDAERRRELGGLLGELNRRGTTLVVATHDLEFAWAFSSRTVSLAEGCLSPETLPARPGESE
jgi:polar amino acid transport system ATP-binding protein